MNLRHVGDDDAGSIMPLVAGFVALALALVLVTVEATGMLLAQKRVEALADSAALAAADGFRLEWRDGQVMAVVDDEAIRAQAEDLLAAYPREAWIISAGAPDPGHTEVTVGIIWHPVMLTPFVPDGVPLIATATATTALH